MTHLISETSHRPLLLEGSGDLGMMCPENWASDRDPHSGRNQMKLNSKET